MSVKHSRQHKCDWDLDGTCCCTFDDWCGVVFMGSYSLKQNHIKVSKKIFIYFTWYLVLYIFLWRYFDSKTTQHKTSSITKITKVKLYQFLLDTLPMAVVQTEIITMLCMTSDCFTEPAITWLYLQLCIRRLDLLFFATTTQPNHT